MHRFFINKEQISDTNIEITGTDVKHIKDVLRLRTKDIIEVSCEGTNYTVKIKEIMKDKVLTDILSSEKGNSESIVDICLFQGLSKGNKMEVIFQKGTEVGVKEFYPVATHRSVVKIKELKKEQSKVERWNAITEEAAKQSKRDIIPKVRDILSFKDMIELLKDEDHIIVPYENEENLSIGESIRDLKQGKINIVIGPEGGFETEEIDALKSIGARIVTLGPRILRTETAGLVTATIVLYEAGNMGVI